MIPKGNQRGGGRQLATHLLNQFDNDNVEVADLRGAVAQDLHGAFHEWFAQSKATKCVKYLYSLSINPDVAKYDLTREQYLDFAARAERSLKLVGQPRAVVFHTKHGRLHCHAVWSRIMPDAGKAVQMDHDRFKLQDVAREFAHDHGLPLPPGMEKKGSSKEKQSDHKEKQQQERSGISKEDVKAAITAVWYEHNEDPRAFVKALEKAGYHLARSATERYTGDKGRYVVIDHAGEVHALARQIEGVRTKQIKAFLGADYPLDKLPDIETARAAAQQSLKDRAEKEKTQSRPEDDGPAKREHDAKERREELARDHAERRSQLDVKSTELEKRIETERRALLDLQTAEKDGVLDARAAKQPRGMLAFLARITGIQAYVAARHSRQDAAREKAHKSEREALERRHGRERHEMGRQYASLAAVETRERQSLEIAVKRREFQILAPKKPPQSVLKPEFDRAVNRAVAMQGGGDSMAPKKEQLMRDFAAAADPQKARQKTGDTGQSPKVRPAPAFTKADLQRAFELAKDPARKPAAGGQEHTEEIAPEKLEQAREKKADLEKRQRGHEKDRDPDRER
jgi:hypothetical protein